MKSMEDTLKKQAKKKAVVAVDPATPKKEIDPTLATIRRAVFEKKFRTTQFQKRKGRVKSEKKITNKNCAFCDREMAIAEGTEAVTHGGECRKFYRKLKREGKVAA